MINSLHLRKIDEKRLCKIGLINKITYFAERQTHAQDNIPQSEGGCFIMKEIVIVIQERSCTEQKLFEYFLYWAANASYFLWSTTRLTELLL